MIDSGGRSDWWWIDAQFMASPAFAQLGALTGPVLLVDDLVDSRWTMTVAGALVRTAGAPAVLPFALASVA